MLAAVGVRLSDVLSAERVLVVEGDSDADVLRTWFPNLLDSLGIQLVAGRRGGDAAWHLEAFQDWLRASDALQRSVRFLRDRDELDAPTVERLHATRSVKVLGRRELEKPGSDLSVSAYVSPNPVSYGSYPTLYAKSTHVRVVATIFRAIFRNV